MIRTSGTRGTSSTVLKSKTKYSKIHFPPQFNQVSQDEVSLLLPQDSINLDTVCSTLPLGTLFQSIFHSVLCAEPPVCSQNLMNAKEQMLVSLIVYNHTWTTQIAYSPQVSNNVIFPVLRFTLGLPTTLHKYILISHAMTRF